MDLRGTLQVGETPAAIKPSDENFGKTRFRRRAPGATAGPFFRVMDGEGYCVQVTFKIKACFPNEALVLRIMRDREESFPPFALRAHPKSAYTKASAPGSSRAGSGGALLRSWTASSDRRQRSLRLPEQWGECALFA